MQVSYSFTYNFTSSFTNSVTIIPKQRGPPFSRISLIRAGVVWDHLPWEPNTWHLRLIYWLRSCLWRSKGDILWCLVEHQRRYSWATLQPQAEQKILSQHRSRPELNFSSRSLVMLSNWPSDALNVATTYPTTFLKGPRHFFCLPTLPVPSKKSP